MSTSEPQRAENSHQKPKFLTDRQVAELTGIGLQTLRNWRMLCKGMPYVKLDKSVRYRESDVLDFMEERRIVPGGSGK